MSHTFFAYHLTHVFGKFGLESYHTNSSKPREGDLLYVVSGDKDGEAPGVDYFLEGIFKIHRRHEGSFPLQSANGELRSYAYRLSMLPVRVPDKPISLSNSAEWYDREEVHRFFSSGQNFNPLPVEPDYKTRFNDLLAGFGSSEADAILEDLAAVAGDLTLTETERQVLAKARIGQGKFRADVVSSWELGETCPLTGLDIPELLVASHIRPWRDCTSSMDRLDPMNGLLLAAHADKLFDRYLLSFERDAGHFKAVLHPRVVAAAKSFGVRQGMPLKTTFLGLSAVAQLANYLSEHLARFRTKVAADSATT